MYGKFDHNIDDKGRVFVPAKLRETLGDEFYVSLGLRKCLNIYTAEKWAEIQEKVTSLPMSMREDMLVIFGNTTQCRPDKQGRITLTAEQRSYGDLGQEVTIIGQGDHAEIWDAASYKAQEAERMNPASVRAVLGAMGI